LSRPTRPLNGFCEVIEELVCVVRRAPEWKSWYRRQSCGVSLLRYCGWIDDRFYGDLARPGNVEIRECRAPECAVALKTGLAKVSL
jgi:hypothetical protein